MTAAQTVAAMSAGGALLVLACTGAVRVPEPGQSARAPRAGVVHDSAIAQSVYEAALRYFDDTILNLWKRIEPDRTIPKYRVDARIGYWDNAGPEPVEIRGYHSDSWLRSLPERYHIAGTCRRTSPRAPFCPGLLLLLGPVERVDSLHVYVVLFHSYEWLAFPAGWRQSIGVKLLRLRGEGEAWTVVSRR